MELKVLKVENKGVAATEKLILSVETNTSDRFMVCDSTYENGNVSNKHPHLLVIPKLALKKGDKVIIHTGHRPKILQPTNANEHHVYRELDISIWNKNGDKAILIKYTASDPVVV